MPGYFVRRRLRRKARQLAHEARHACAMREDVAAPEDLARARAAAAGLREAAAAGDGAAFERAVARLGEAVSVVAPPRRAAMFRENLEIAVVALAVAMGFRTFFVQPFKIPTGSMQPTLFGVTVAEQVRRTWIDYPPVSLLRWALFGEGFVEVKAKRSGTVESRVQRTEDGYLLFVDGVGHALRRNMPRRCEPGDFVTRGQVLASGRVRMGDHIFVNKVRYNFLRPGRGDIIVFDTNRIEHPGIRRNSFYIKRLVGLPGEEVAVHPPYLVVDGKRVEEPYPFWRLLNAERRGYHGYDLALGRARPRPLLMSETDTLQLGPNEFLPFGDNTRSSLDGRYFGPVDRRSLVGPAFAVYWPLSRRWGMVR